MAEPDLKELLEKNQEILDNYENGVLGLPNNEPPGEEEELQEYLTMPADFIEGISAERSLSISIRLSQFSFYVQRSINKHKSMRTWADYELNKIIAQEIDKYDQFTKADIKIAQICRSNQQAYDLLKIKNYANQLIDRLYDLSSGIKNLSYVFSLSYKQKIGERND